MNTYIDLCLKQSCIAYTIQDLQNELKSEKNQEKIKTLQETIDKYIKELDEVLLMLENGEYENQDDDDYDEEFISNGQIRERIEACYDY
jgi:hypothetical protein